MTDSERQLLSNVRRGLLHLHKTLLDWERVSYDREHGRTSPGLLLKIVMTDPHFAWLRPVSELIVRIDGVLDMESPDSPIDVEGILNQAKALVTPEEGSPDRQRYHAALQESPDAVLAHGAVTAVLRQAPRPPERVH